MADLLPSSPDPSAGDGGEPRVVGVDSDDADDLLAALQSETARDLLSVLYDDPATVSTLAEELDTSIQNVRYHLDRLTDADLVEVADTAYSEKGREMKVYAPSAKPLVVFAGDDDDTSGVEAALSRLLGALGILGLSSLAVQRFFGGGNTGDDNHFTGQPAAETSEGTNVSFDSGSEVEVPTTVEEEAAETTRAVTEETVDAATTVADGAADAGGAALGTLPPGLVFFAGGLVVLLALGAAWYLRDR